MDNSISFSQKGGKIFVNISSTSDREITVKIIDEGILRSGQQIDVTLENNSAYTWMTKRYLGLHADYKFNDGHSRRV